MGRRAVEKQEDLGVDLPILVISAFRGQNPEDHWACCPPV